MTDLASLNALKAQLDTAAQAVADASSAVAAIILAETPTPTPAPDPGPVINPDPTPTPTPVPTPPVNTRSDIFGPVELAAKVKAANPGDAFTVKSGEYGAFTLNAVNRGGRVSLFCEGGAHFERFVFSGVRNVTLDGVTAYPDKTAPLPSRGVIDGDANSTGIEIRNAKIGGGVDADDFLNWDLAKWQARKTLGIVLEGTGCTISDATLTGLGIAAIIGGAGSAMQRMKVRGFSVDGLRARGNGDGWLLEDLDIAYGVTISSAHPDGVQCWSKAPGGLPGTGLMSGLVIRRALLREWIGARSSITATMQGIGLHDGLYDAPLVEDVTVYNTSVWGIHIGGCKTPPTIRNNKVLHLNRTGGDRPRIGASAPNSSGNVANKYTYTPGVEDRIANYADLVMAPQMPTAA